MDTSLWSQTRSSASLLWVSSADGSACTHDEFSPLWVGVNSVDVTWVTPSSSHDDDRVADARTPEPIVAEPGDSTTLVWNTLRLFFVTESFQTFVRAIGENELLVAQMRAEARSQLGSDSDSQPHFLRTRCYPGAPGLGRFLPRDPL